jgi:hypothetical protein
MEMLGGESEPELYLFYRLVRLMRSTKDVIIPARKTPAPNRTTVPRPTATILQPPLCAKIGQITLPRTELIYVWLLFTGWAFLMLERS